MKKLLIPLSFLLLFSCGTKTKNKSEFVEKTNKEVLIKDSINKVTEVIVNKVEESLTEYREQSKNDLSDKVRVTETTETLDYSGGEPLVVETPQGIIRVSGNGRITKHTKTSFQEIERREIESKNIELLNKLQIKMDSINEATIIKQQIEQTATDIVVKQSNKEVVKSSGSFWLWFWIILILLIIYALYRVYVRYGNPFLIAKNWILKFIRL